MFVMTLASSSFDLSVLIVNMTMWMRQLFEVNMYDLQPIRDRETHRAALTEIERLFDVPAGTPEFDRLEVLVTLVEAYERKHEPIRSPEPIEAILYYMESRGLTRQDLEPAIGNRATVAEILNRKRPLTLEMIRRLHEQLGIPAQTLIQSYALASA
jgi:HTH-type transcriptional regulator / antitoxin HigA